MLYNYVKLRARPEIISYATLVLAYILPVALHVRWCRLIRGP